MKTVIRSAPLLLAAVVLALAACAEDPPQIRDVSWEVLYRRHADDGSVRESLSLFVLVDDADGPEDLAGMELLRENTGYIWNVPPEDRVSPRLPGLEDGWTGHGDLRPGPTGRFAPGGYVVSISDRAGHEDGLRFVIPPGRPRASEIVFPEVRREDGEWILGNQAPAYRLWFRDDAGSWLYSLSVPPGRYEDNEWRQDSAAVGFDVYYRRQDISRGVVSGPYLFGVPAP